MKLFNLITATAAKKAIDWPEMAVFVGAERPPSLMIEELELYEKRFSKFINFYAEEGAAGRGGLDQAFATKIVSKYQKLMRNTSKIVKKAKCERFPYPTWYENAIKNKTPFNGYIPEDLSSFLDTKFDREGNRVRFSSVP